MSDYSNEREGMPQCMSSADALLIKLAIQYHHRSEAHDRTVCTGPLTRLGMLPATPEQRDRSIFNAWRLSDEMAKDAERLGFSRGEWNQAIRLAARDIDWRTVQPNPLNSHGCDTKTSRILIDKSQSKESFV